MTTTINEQVKRFLPIAKRVVFQSCRRLTPGQIDRDQVLSAATFAIVRALRDFDPAHRASLRTWIFTRCRWAALDAIRTQIGRPGRLKIRPANASTLWMVNEQAQPLAPEPEPAEDLRDEVKRLIASVDLTPREEELMRARYIEGRNHDEIASARTDAASIAFTPRALPPLRNSEPTTERKPMFEQKLFEIRDRHTLICALAIRWQSLHTLSDGDERDRWMFRRAGFAPDQPVTYLMKLSGGAEYDPFKWGGSRTMRRAHCYIEKHWDALENGQVIDVEFVLGETAEPKRTEQLTESA